MFTLKNIIKFNPVQGQVRDLTRIAGRANLAGSEHPGFPQSLKGPAENLPFILTGKNYGITPQSSPEECAEAINDTFKDLLYKHSALLLKGFPLGDLNNYTRFISHLKGVTHFSYTQGTGYRHALNDQVLAASDYPNESTIEPHNEMSSNLTHPKIVSFACKQPAENGGESVLFDSAAWLQQLDKAVRDEFEKKGGILYHLYLKKEQVAFNGQKLGGDISWQYIFRTDNKKQVEEDLIQSKREFIWHEEDDLQFWYSQPATIHHHKTGVPQWFNQAHAHHASFINYMYPKTWGRSGIPYDKYPYHSYYADGSEIPDEVLAHIRNVAWSVAVGFQLQKDEVILVDNERMAHGRLDYTGNRTLYAALLDDTD